MMVNATLYNSKINEAVESGITNFISLDLEVKQRLIKAAFLKQGSEERKDLIKDALQQESVVLLIESLIRTNGNDSIDTSALLIEECLHHIRSVLAEQADADIHKRYKENK